MSTSWGNVITIVDEPNDMFGKIMSVKDELIEKYFKLCTDVSDIPKNENPRDNKIILGYEIVKIYHGEKKAKEAQENFINTFQKKEIPDEMDEIDFKEVETVIASGHLGPILVLKKIVSSMNEWRRLVEQNAIHDLENDTRITDVNFKVEKNLTLKIGKKKFIKIIIK
jgi:tyrosyl-tRNA synthetase